ncbi:MAG: hypothetical protein GY841_12360 [FCB group bacterium]|nr:hypothetical protein [FCB group bacterium]
MYLAVFERYIKGGEMSLPDEVINMASVMLKDLFVENRGKIALAYDTAGAEVSVGLNAKIFEQGGKVRVDATINFVEKRCKETRTRMINTKQLELFGSKDDAA